MARPPVFCAIDTAAQDLAAELAQAVKPHIAGVKLGLEFFCAHGPEGVRAVADGADALFLDLKLHDIPNTVAGAVRAASALAPDFLTIHCAGGPAMMTAAAEAAKETGGGRRTKLLGVTVLTSLDKEDLRRTGIHEPGEEQVVRLAGLAQESGLDGVVCSPREIEAVRAVCGPGFTLVVPGIRPAGAARDDQKRVMTPGEALAAGADYLVIGRPITAADDPARAAAAIARELT